MNKHKVGEDIVMLPTFLFSLIPSSWIVAIVWKFSGAFNTWYAVPMALTCIGIFAISVLFFMVLILYILLETNIIEDKKE